MTPIDTDEDDLILLGCIASWRGRTYLTEGTASYEACMRLWRLGKCRLVEDGESLYVEPWTALAR